MRRDPNLPNLGAPRLSPRPRPRPSTRATLPPHSQVASSADSAARRGKRNSKNGRKHPRVDEGRPPAMRAAADAQVLAGGDEVDGAGEEPRSPRSPRSPGSPRSPFLLGPPAAQLMAQAQASFVRAQKL